MISEMRKTAPVIGLFLALISIAPGISEPLGISAVQLRSLELESQGSDGVYSPFGTYFAVITRTNRVRVYNSNYDELWNYRGRGRHGSGPALAFTADEQFVIFPGFGASSRIGVLRAASGEMVTAMDGHSDDVVALALSPDNRWLVSVQSGGTTIIWRREGVGFSLHQRLERKPVPVLSLTFAPSSILFAIGNNQDFVELFVLADGESSFQAAEELKPNQYYGNTAYLFGLTFSPDGRRLAAGVRDEITIWELDGADLLSTSIIPEIDAGYCYSVRFSPDGRLLFGGFQGSRTAVWSYHESGDWLHEITFSDRQDQVWDLTISPDGSHLATVSVTANGVAIWELDGVEPGPLSSLSTMLAEATEGEGPSQAHKSILTDTTAIRIISALDPGLFAPRGMFETALAYEKRKANASVSALHAVQTELLLSYRGSGPDETGRITVPLEEQGTYEIDAGRYATAIMGTTAALAIFPEEAEDLYLNWESAVVEAVLGERPGVYTEYELIHPKNGKRYPIILKQDPLSGFQFEPVVEIHRPLDLTDDLVLEQLRIDPVFPSLYRAYEHMPIGNAVLRNTGDFPAEDLSLAAVLSGYSIEPAEIAAPPALAPGARVPIDFGLVLSDKTVKSGGDQTVSIEITAEYTTEGTRRAGSITTLLPILNRNAIRWDDDLKVGAFMTTVQSPTVMAIAAQAAIDTADTIAASLPRQLVIGMRVLEQLRSHGLAYRVDPASSYADLSRDTGLIDFLQFPVETLAYGAGDCDDISVLYNSILEAAGVRTAFITTPGHIFTAFLLSGDVREASGIFPDRGEFIIRDGDVWIPVETTALNQGFREAWLLGARQWRAAEAGRTAEMFTTDEAWMVYPPVPWEPAVNVKEPKGAEDRFLSELDSYVEEAVELMIQSRNVSMPQSARDHNIRGTIYARFGLFDQARRSFEHAVDIDEYVPALVNLAGVTAIEGDHAAAREILKQADALSPENPRILLGLAVEHLEEGQRGSARDFYNRAAAIDPRITTDFPLFAAGGSDENGARASGGDAAGAYRRNEWME